MHFFGMHEMGLHYSRLSCLVFTQYYTYIVMSIRLIRNSLLFLVVFLGFCWSLSLKKPVLDWVSC